MTFKGILAFAVGVILLGQTTGSHWSSPKQTHASSAQQDNEDSKSANHQLVPAESSSLEIDNAPTTITEARIRARLLHEAFHGALQVMHRDFFREDKKLSLPSNSLEDVFSEMAKSHQVELRWLAVNANAMSQSHEPESDFEKSAVEALASGKSEFETSTRDSYKFAGSIRLSASCVKCHVRNRSSNDERKAALVITMPLN